MTDIEKAKELAEVSKKYDAQERDLKNKLKYLESDIRFKRDTTQSASDVKYSAKKLESLEKKRDSLK